MPTIQSGKMRLQVDDVAASFSTALQSGEDWSPASLSSRPVEGAQGEALAAGTWQTRFREQAGGLWVESTLRLDEAAAFAPGMILWLGQLDDLDDRQAHTWRQTILRAPTANQAGLGGNDLPAGYLYDHSQRVATIVYFPPDSLVWASRRFHEFSVREVIQYSPEPRYGFGLVLNPASGPIGFAPGTHHFRWWFTQREIADGPPSLWEAQGQLLDAITPLLDKEPRIYADAPGWDVMAGQAATDLKHEACWIEAGGVRGLRAYVRGSSAVGRDRQQGFELMTQLDVLHPLLLWQRLTANTAADGLVGDLLKTLPHFSFPEFDFVANGFPKRANATFMDTWYFLENALIKLPWVAALTGDALLRDLFAQAMRGADRLMAQCGGVVPLFADAVDWRARGSVLNAGAAGLYAAGAVLAAQLLDRPDYLERAWEALNRIHQLPPAMLTHEPQQLGFGAAAAGYLAGHGYGDRARAIAGDLVRLSLRMGYWAPDPAVPSYDPRGMFQACASLSYPAYKENIETLLAWPALLADERNHPFLPVDLMAAFANLQRCHNYAFFDAWLPERVRQGPCPHIPYEDLATAEFPHTARLGKELYGAGEVFWSALLFNLHGSVDAPSVLCLSLDVPGLGLQLSAGPARFLLYNPDSEQRSVRLTTASGERPVLLSRGFWTITTA